MFCDDLKGWDGEGGSRGRSCEHNGMSEESEGSHLGWSVGRGQIMMVLQAKKVLSEGEM